MNPWLKLLSDIFKFVVLLFQRPRLVLFLLIFVIGIGGIGIWIPLWSWKVTQTGLELDVYKNLSTYLIAIAITSFAEKFFLRKSGDDERNLMLFAFGLGALGVVFAIMILITNTVERTHLYASTAALATFWLWFIALADSPAFDEEEPTSPIGGRI